MKSSNKEIFSLYDRNIPVSISEFKQNEFSNAYDSHWHEKIEILIVTEGAIQTICDENVVIAEKGDIVFINPCEIHSGKAEASGVKYYCIIIEPNFFVSVNMDSCDKKIIELKNSKIKVQNLISDEKLFSLLLSVIDEQKKKKDCCEIFIRSYLTLFIGEVIRNYYNKKMIVTDNIVTKIIRYINANCGSKLSSNDVAKHFGLSLSYFCRYFKTTVGETVTEYINTVRISKACELLQNTDFSVTEISEMAGYAEISYFNKKFKAKMKCTPLTFRKTSRL